LPNRNFWGS